MDQGAAQARRQGGGAPAEAGGARVTILMGLHNGARHLRAQLDSIAAQTHADWRLIVSDDGSTDEGPAIVTAFARTLAAPREALLVPGPRAGFARNYLSLFAGLEDGPGWIALADQDDIWLPGRLEHGIAALRGLSGPALYCSRTLIFDGDPGRTRLSPPRPRPPGFGNALVQNIAAGNTILLNPAAADILIAAARVTPGVVAHDWWAYQLVAGAGGRIVHDDRPSLLYRQHRGNAIGANDGLLSKLNRLWLLLNGTMRDWTTTNLAALRAADPWLSEPARAMAADLAALRAEPGLLRRLAAFRRMGLYRQTRASTLALWFAVATRRL